MYLSVPSRVVRRKIRIHLHLCERNREEVVLARVECPVRFENEVILAVH